MNKNLKIKVCGMTDAENIQKIDLLDIDFMGFIFYEKSPRYVHTIPSYLPQRAKRVGVFVNDSIEKIIEKHSAYHFDYIQLHGKESPEYCSIIKGKTNLPIIKAFSIESVEDLLSTEAYENICDYYLFDTKCKTVGGSGQQFDWDILKHYKGSTFFLLSGGISPETIQSLLQFHHPRWQGIDLNSRFETSPGMKDVKSLKHFIEQIR